MKYENNHDQLKENKEKICMKCKTEHRNIRLINYNIEWSYEARKVWVDKPSSILFSYVLGKRKIYDIHSSGCCYAGWKKNELGNIYQLLVFLISKGFLFRDTYQQFLKIKKFCENETKRPVDIYP
jgi:hypothetical protein